MNFVPTRIDKPRDVGRTNLLDKGMGTACIKSYLEQSHQYVDVVKLGWGTSFVTLDLSAKLDVYRSFDIDICFGGTALEYAVLTNNLENYIQFIKDNGVKYVEVSDGVIEFNDKEKYLLIERLAKEFIVYSEVGSKDAKVIASPSKWVNQIKLELKAGANLVILEGRESGSAGLYRGNGEIRMGLVEDIFASDIALADLIFEAPQKCQQVWLLEQYGANVNLGNIAIEDILSLETLRRGLRADTLMHFHNPSTS